MGPPLTSVRTLRSAGQGQVDGGIFIGCSGDCLFIEETGRAYCHGLEPRGGPHCTNVD